MTQPPEAGQETVQSQEEVAGKAIDTATEQTEKAAQDIRQHTVRGLPTRVQDHMEAGEEQMADGYKDLLKSKRTLNPIKNIKLKWSGVQKHIEGAVWRTGALPIELIHTAQGVHKPA